jgi:hypothetical protein
MNGKTCDLTVEQLVAVERGYKKGSQESVLPEKKGLGYIAIAFGHIKGLFATPRMALSAGLVFTIICMCYSTSFDWTLL